MTILSVAQLEEHITTTLGDDALGRLLDAAEESIIERAGPAIDEYLVTDTTERFAPRGPVLMLARRATDIVLVTEYAHLALPTTLAADDYELSSSGNLLRRVQGGTHSSDHWNPEVAVTYTPYTDAATRQRVQIELVKLDIAVNPGLSMQVVGSWTEQYQSKPYSDLREEILASLHADPVVMY